MSITTIFDQKAKCKDKWGRLSGGERLQPSLKSSLQVTNSQNNQTETFSNQSISGSFLNTYGLIELPKIQCNLFGCTCGKSAPFKYFILHQPWVYHLIVVFVVIVAVLLLLSFVLFLLFFVAVTDNNAYDLSAAFASPVLFGPALDIVVIIVGMIISLLDGLYFFLWQYIRTFLIGWRFTASEIRNPRFN